LQIVEEMMDTLAGHFPCLLLPTVVVLGHKIE
jgi:hypothetical protein